MAGENNTLLSYEQFQELLDAGLDVKDIEAFEKGFVPPAKGFLRKTAEEGLETITGAMPTALQIGGGIMGGIKGGIPGGIAGGIAGRGGGELLATSLRKQPFRTLFAPLTMSSTILDPRLKRSLMPSLTKEDFTSAGEATLREIPGEVASGLVGWGIGKGLNKLRGVGQAGKVKPVLKSKDAYLLSNAEQADFIINSTRRAKGQAVGQAIEKVKNVNVNAKALSKELTGVPEKFHKVFRNPMYGIEYLPDGSIKPTIGNMQKMLDAIGDQMTSKEWIEATDAETRLFKRFYGSVREAMKTAAKKVGRPINKAIDEYHNLMDKYGDFQRLKTPKTGEVAAGKFKTMFQAGKGDPVLKRTWDELVENIPQLGEISANMSRLMGKEELLKKVGRTARYLFPTGVIGAAAYRGFRGR